MAIKAGVRASHAIIQNRLNGSPSTRGVTRSHNATEKHKPPKGTSDNKIEPSDGLLNTLR